MKILKIPALILSVSILAACAVTPAQKEAEAKAKAQELLNTQISLAQECDPKAAQLIAQMPTADQMSPAQKKTFERNYVKHVNNPAFKACYNLAWRSYQEQNQLKIAEMQEWEESTELDWNSGMFYNDPFGWDGGWGPY